MAFWNFFTKAEKQKKKAANLYKSVVALSRNQDLFIGMNIEDSVDGRFNSITLHLSLILRRLKKEGNVYETDIKFKNLKGEDLKNGLLLI